MNRKDLNDPDTIHHFMKRAKYCAKKRGYPQLADDFVGWMFIEFLKHPDRRSTVDQLFIDFLRESYGRTGKPGGDARSRAEHTMSSISNEDTPSLNHYSYDPRGCSGDKRSDGEFAFCFQGRDLELYERIFINEETARSIADEWGVSEAYISQRLRPIKRTIRSQSILWNGIERMECDDTFLSFRVDWLVI